MNDNATEKRLYTDKELYEYEAEDVLSKLTDIFLDLEDLSLRTMANVTAGCVDEMRGLINSLIAEIFDDKDDMPDENLGFEDYGDLLPKSAQKESPLNGWEWFYCPTKYPEDSDEPVLAQCQWYDAKQQESGVYSVVAKYNSTTGIWSEAMADAERDEPPIYDMVVRWTYIPVLYSKTVKAE